MASAKTDGRPFVDTRKKAVTAPSSAASTSTYLWTPSGVRVAQIVLQTIDEKAIIERECSALARTKRTVGKVPGVWLKFCMTMIFLTEGQGQLLLIDLGSAVATCPCSHAAHVPLPQGNVTTMVGAGVSHAIQHFGLKDVQHTTDSGANLTLKYNVCDVRFPMVCVFRTVAAGCVLHFESVHSFSEFPHRDREW